MKSGFAVLIVLSMFIANYANALSCIGYSNAQEAARANDTQVSKVKLEIKDEQTNSYTLKVLKTYKGDQTVKKILIKDEMGYGVTATGKSVGDEWIEIFSPTDVPGEYYTLACAVSSFEITENNKINVSVSFEQDFDISEQEFDDYINGKTRPEFYGLSCSLNFYSDSHSFTEQFEVPNGDAIESEKDLSQFNSKWSPLQFSVSVYDEIGMSFLDPQSKVTMMYGAQLDSRDTYGVYTLRSSSEESGTDIDLVCSMKYAPVFTAVTN